jgi:hypothetical protein
MKKYMSSPWIISATEHRWKHEILEAKDRQEEIQSGDIIYREL